jgi:hypothetical protein
LTFASKDPQNACVIVVALDWEALRDMRKDRQIFDREGKPLTMKNSFVPSTQNWVHFASRSSKQAVGQVPDLPSAAGAYPAKSGSLATPEKNAKGTQDKIGFVPHFPCIPMKLNAIRASKRASRPNIQPPASSPKWLPSSTHLEPSTNEKLRA